MFNNKKTKKFASSTFVVSYEIDGRKEAIFFKEYTHAIDFYAMLHTQLPTIKYENIAIANKQEYFKKKNKRKVVRKSKNILSILDKVATYLLMIAFIIMCIFIFVDFFFGVVPGIY